MSTNYARFVETLEQQYVELFETPEYHLARARTTPASLAVRMTASLVSGTASKDGEGIKRTCKILGVKYNCRSIVAFLMEGE